MPHLSSLRNLFRCIIAAAALMSVIAMAVPAYASLVLTIDNYTSSTLAFTISGTFEDATVGSYVPGYLAIKSDWSHNIGVHTELWTGTNPTPTIVSNTLTIGGSPPLNSYLAYSGQTYGDAFYVVNPLGLNNPIVVGTAVSGSVLLSVSNGSFDPAAINLLQLVSGMSNYSGKYDWARLEATATVVPIPGEVWLLGSGLLGIVGIRRKFE